MTEKKSPNPFINMANAAKAVAANPKVPEGGLEYVKRWHDGQESIKALSRVFKF
mgnify:CR=1 FL=1